MTDAVTRALAAIAEMREHLSAALAPYPHLRADLSAYAPDGAVSLILNGNGRSVRVLLVGEHEIADESYKPTLNLRIGLAIEVYAQSGPPAVTTQYLKAAQKFVEYVDDFGADIRQRHYMAWQALLIADTGYRAAMRDQFRSEHPNAVPVAFPFVEKPWVVCHNNYSCREISRIDFSKPENILKNVEQVLAFPENPLASPTGETWTKVTADGVTHGTSLGALIDGEIARGEKSWQKTRGEALAELGFRPDSAEDGAPLFSTAHPHNRFESEGHSSTCALTVAAKIRLAHECAKLADVNAVAARNAYNAELTKHWQSVSAERWRELDALESKNIGRDLTGCDCGIGEGSDW